MTDASENAPLDDARERLDALARETEALEGDVRAAAARLRAGLERVRADLDALTADSAERDAGGGHASGADVDGARLTALDLVLQDTPRPEARSMITAQFPGVDADLLLDELDATSSG